MGLFVKQKILDQQQLFEIDLAINTPVAELRNKQSALFATVNIKK